MTPDARARDVRFTLSWWRARRSSQSERSSLSGPAAIFVIGYLVLLTCIPSQLIFGPLGAPGTPANLWGIAAMVWWICATVGGMNPVRGFTPIRIAVAVIVIAVLASYVNGMTSGWYAPPGVGQSTDDVLTLVVPTVDQVNTAMISAAGRGLISFAAWLGVVLLTAEGLRSWKDLEMVVTWLVWLGVFVATLGIIQFFFGLDIASFFRIPGLVANSDFGAVTERSSLNRVSSTAVHPIEYGVVLSAILPLAIHRSIYRWGEKLVLPPTILIAFGMLLAVSRSAVLVAVVALVLFMIGWPSAWRKRAMIVLPLSVVMTRAVVPGLIGTIYSLFHDLFNDPSVQGRTQDYGVVFSLYSDHIWLGRGLFTFIPRFYRILDNEFLVMLLELGLLGLLAVIGFFLTGYACARGVHHHARTARSRHLGLSLSASVAGVVVSYATFDAWSFPMAAGLTFAIIGMSAAAWNVSDRESGHRRSSKAPLPARKAGSVGQR